MKLKKIYAAMAISTMASPMAAIGNNEITSALSGGKITGEVFGGYWNTSIDLDAGSSFNSDSSDITFDRARLGYEAQVKDNVIFGAELEFYNSSSLNFDTEATSGLDEQRFTDLFLQKQRGDQIQTLGRFKQTFNRESAVELSDALFTQVAGINDSTFQSSLSGFSSSDFSIISDVLGGADRRIEGGEIKGANAAGLNYTFALYKGGVDQRDGDSDRGFGYAASIGWQGGEDGLLFGFNAGLFMENGDETTNTVAIDEITDSSINGVRLSGSIATGPLTGTVYYADNILEYQIDDNTTPDLENSTIGFDAALNFGGAARTFDGFNVRQGPSLAKEGWGYEAVVNYRLDTLESDGAADIDINQWGLGINAYCSEHTKIYGSYSTVEIDAGASQKPTIDQIAVGLVLNF